VCRLLHCRHGQRCALSSVPFEQHHARISAPQLARDIRALEAKGYVPTSCTVTGTLMHNYVTDQSVTINW